MADDIEDRDVHLCRVGLAELLTALEEKTRLRVPEPIKPVRVHVKVIEAVADDGSGASGRPDRL